MKDDTSNIETGSSCYVVNNAKTIYSYKGSIRKTYIQIGGKWFLSSQSNYYNIPDNSICWSYDDITSLNSNAEFLPIYDMIALTMAVFVWYIVFKLISRLIKWKP